MGGCTARVLCAEMRSWPAGQEVATVFAADRPRFAHPHTRKHRALERA